MGLRFRILAQDGAARRGRLSTPHGELETPAFMPVASSGSVKGLTPADLESAGASILLANLYHLRLRPGVEVISELGGLHRFMGWPGPILTDSGGFQVFSLARLCSVDRDGVTFRSHIDGAPVRFTPGSVVRLQLQLGVDLAMVLDECSPWPVSREEACAALARTNDWARRAREEWPGGPGGLLGILQGSVFQDLRQGAIEELVPLDFDGYAIGGLSVGEPEEERRRVVAWTAPNLPPDRVRYLMGVGTPEELLWAVGQGVDLFDCVLPTRNGRHGVLFTRRGILRIRNARFRDDPRPVDPDCGCLLCRRLSRALLCHLMKAGELTGPVLATLHNLRFYLDFMAELREAIAAGTLADLAAAEAVRSCRNAPFEPRTEGARSAASDPPSQSEDHCPR